MNRFYVAEAITEDEAIISDQGQLHHLRDVLRLKPGDGVEVCDSAGSECVCVVLEIGREKARVAVQSRRPARASSTRIAVACSLPKRDGMDEVIEKLTQLGVDEIIPLRTERVVVRLNEVRVKARAERWQRVARSAAQQSHRNRLPVVQPLTDMEHVFSQAADFDLRLMPTLAGETRSLKEVVAGRAPRSVLVLIGPEGDFTGPEVEQAVRAGFVPVSLGPLILRVSTAAIAVVSYLRLALD